MKNSFAAMLLLFSFCSHFKAAAREPELGSTFPSVEKFIAEMKPLRPSHSKSDLAKFFTATDEDGGGGKKTVRAATLESVERVTNADEPNVAVVFARAEPSTDTKTVVGVLFLLARQNDGWKIADLLRFEGNGREAGIGAEETSFHSPPGWGGNALTVTVSVSNGGRRWSYSVSESYTVEGGKFSRRALAPTRADGKELAAPSP